jgi:hypothetical protein
LNAERSGGELSISAGRGTALLPLCGRACSNIQSAIGRIARECFAV